MDLHKWRVYQESLTVLEEVVAWTRTLPRGSGWLADQARRAAGSVTLNVAEGLGRPSKAERRRFFEIAIGSAHEVAACLDVGCRLGTLSEARRAAIWGRCDSVTRMPGAILRGRE